MNQRTINYLCNLTATRLGIEEEDLRQIVAMNNTNALSLHMYMESRGVPEYEAAAVAIKYGGWTEREYILELDRQWRDVLGDVMIQLSVPLQRTSLNPVDSGVQ